MVSHVTALTSALMLATSVAASADEVVIEAEDFDCAEDSLVPVQVLCD